MSGNSKLCSIMEYQIINYTFLLFFQHFRNSNSYWTKVFATSDMTYKTPSSICSIGRKPADTDTLKKCADITDTDTDASAHTHIPNYYYSK